MQVPLWRLALISFPIYSMCITTKKLIFGRTAVVPEPSWSRPGRDLAPKTSRERIVIDFGTHFG